MSKNYKKQKPPFCDKSQKGGFVKQTINIEEFL